MRKKLTHRIIAVLLIASGIVLGVTWNNAKFCVGDKIFSALGLPPWSNGASGTHYPAVIGSFAVLIGIGVLNCTLQKKARLWVWISVVPFLIMLNLGFAYL